MQFILIGFAILLGFSIGMFLGIDYVATALNKFITKCMQDAYDIGVKETKRRFNIEGDDLK